MQGSVKWFSDSKGYGFISRPGQNDLFVHVSSILNADSLREGAKVSFEEGEGKRGPAAIKVKVIQE